MYVYQRQYWTEYIALEHAGYDLPGGRLFPLN